ncbi:MAG: amino acid--tRNA ligase-related protein [bacterium]|nr:amino acid--tRNA ligase-related protein [bacterium]
MSKFAAPLLIRGKKHIVVKRKKKDQRRVENPPPALTTIPRSDTIIKIKNVIAQSQRGWFVKHGYLEEWYPVITSATGSCEAVGNVYFVEIADGLVRTLMQTSQLEIEEQIILGELFRIFTFARSCRKEHGGMDIKDGRHLTDFLLVEWEALNVNLKKLIDDNVSMIRYIIETVLASTLLPFAQHDNLYAWYTHFKKHDIRITYKTAIKELQDQGFPIKYGDDLSSDAERVLTQTFGIHHVTHYPEKIKFFNMLRSRKGCPGTKGSVECADLLMPYAGETTGMSQREYDYDILVEKLYNAPMYSQLMSEYKQRGANTRQVEADFERYLNLFKGAALQWPNQKRIFRSGAGQGGGRLLQFILSSDKIIQW